MDHSSRSAEMNHLVNEMERMDEDLALHLSKEFATRARAGGVQPPLEFARLQIRAWCARAARQQKYDAEVLASTLMAIESMDRHELAAMIRALVLRAQGTTHRPAA